MILSLRRLCFSHFDKYFTRFTECQSRVSRSCTCSKNADFPFGLMFLKTLDLREFFCIASMLRDCLRFLISNEISKCIFPSLFGPDGKTQKRTVFACGLFFWREEEGNLNLKFIDRRGPSRTASHIWVNRWNLGRVELPQKIQNNPYFWELNSSRALIAPGSLAPSTSWFSCGENKGIIEERRGGRKKKELGRRKKEITFFRVLKFHQTTRTLQAIR